MLARLANRIISRVRQRTVSAAEASASTYDYIVVGAGDARVNGAYAPLPAAAALPRYDGPQCFAHTERARLVRRSGAAHGTIRSLLHLM